MLLIYCGEWDLQKSDNVKDLNVKALKHRQLMCNKDGDENVQIDTAKKQRKY